MPFVPCVVPLTQFCCEVEAQQVLCSTGKEEGAAVAALLQLALHQKGAHLLALALFRIITHTLTQELDDGDKDTTCRPRHGAAAHEQLMNRPWTRHE